MRKLIFKSLCLTLMLSVLSGCSTSKKSINETEVNDSNQESGTADNFPTTSSHDYILSVKTKVRAESDKVADCYTEAINESEDLVGKIYFAWSIVRDGGIEKLRVNRDKSTIASEKLETCMIDIFNQIKFDPLVGKDYVHINYPFKFTGKKKR